jgi:hypothetical protein
MCLDHNPKFSPPFGCVNPTHVASSFLCFDHNPKFSPPFGCINPTHIASSYSYIDLVHVATSSNVNPTHITSFNYINPNVVAFFTIILDPKRKKSIVDDNANLSLPLNPVSRKQNYDHNKKFQDLRATKLPWAKMCLGSNGLLHNVKCKTYNRVEEKTSSLLLSGTHFAST